jgi:hypothetical protein
MCLANVTRRATEFTGFKVMIRGSDRLLLGSYYTAPEAGYKQGQWYSAQPYSGNGSLYASNGDPYSYGFHIIPTARHMLKYWNLTAYAEQVLVRVRYRGVLAQGIDQTSEEVSEAKIRGVVAAQMLIEEVIEHEHADKYLTDLLPKPKRKTITVAEFANIFNNSHTMSVLEEKMNALLGYDFQYEVLKREAKVKVEKRPIYDPSF